MKNEPIFLRPLSAKQAIEMAAMHEEGFRFLAGGTDVFVNKQQGNDAAGCLIDITGIDELKQITIQRGILKIGALVNLDAIAENELVQKHIPVLAEAVHTVASPVIRKTATLGGNLLCENRCNFYNQSEWWRQAIGYCLKCDGDFCIATGGKKRCFSKFSSDLAIVLICHDSNVNFAQKNEMYSTALEKIYTGDGVNPRNPDKTALLLSVEIPVHRNFRAVYNKLRPRLAMDFTSLTSTISLDIENNVKIALGGVDPMPVVVKGNVNQKDEMIQRAIKRARIVDNDVYSRSYRKKMIGVFLKKGFEKLDEKSPLKI